MAEYLDMALDDIIINKQRLRGPTKGPRRGIGSLGSPGPARRFPNHSSPRMAPYAPRPVTVSDDCRGYYHHMHPLNLMPMLPPILEEQKLIDAEADSESGVKLYISNLDYEVTNHDIMILFSDIGDLKQYGIHCDKSGRSKGTAEVVFTRKMDAIAAMKRFNNVELDGKPMHIEIVGGQHLVTAAAPPWAHLYGNRSILGQPPSSFWRGEPMFGGSGGRGGVVPWVGKMHEAAKFGRQKKASSPSAQDLDADLERYRLEGLQMQ